MNQLFIQEIVLILFCAFCGGYIALKFKQPAFIGYLAAGIVLSLPLFSDSINFDISRDIAQVGVAFLLFTIGLEFPISKLLKTKRNVIIGAVLQTTLFILLATTGLSRFNFTTYEALFLSAAFSNSATILVLQLIEDKTKVDTSISKSIISWIIIQDIMAVIIAILIGSLSTDKIIDIYDILEAIAKSIILIGFAILFGKKLVPKFFEMIARLHSTEILVVLSCLFCVAMAFLTETLGLPYTFGAFLAGMMISESFVNHEIFSEIRPLRDLFSIIFYSTIGVLFSGSFLVTHILQVILVLTVLLLFKFLSSFIIIVFLEKQTRKAFIMSAIMIQGGEFAFILSQAGLEHKWINEDLYSLILIVTVLSFFLTPAITNNSMYCYLNLREYLRKKFPRLYELFFIKLDNITDIDQPDIKNHIVICGFGRVGNYIGKALLKFEMPYIVIDSDTDRIDYCKQRGIKTIFGDASNIDILEKADIERAAALVIALPQEGACEVIAVNALTLNPDIKIVARSHTPADNKRLRDKGVTVTVEPEFEAAISISKQILNFLGKEQINITKYLKKSRRRQRSKLNTNIDSS